MKNILLISSFCMLCIGFSSCENGASSGLQAVNSGKTERESAAKIVKNMRIIASGFYESYHEWNRSPYSGFCPTPSQTIRPPANPGLQKELISKMFFISHLILVNCHKIRK